jgi:hypothetical protein
MTETSGRLRRNTHRCLPDLVQALADFNARVDQAVARKGLDAHQARRVREIHLPVALLEERARLVPNREERRRIKAVVAGLREQEQRDVDDVASLELHALARELAAHWQRTTSRIEGRNGHLSQRHHDGRGLSARKLACLTHIHYFHTRSADGATAAEKFFGKKHIDLARATLAAMKELKRPRASRQAA